MRTNPGQAVFVPFGARVLQGIVTGYPDAAEVDDVREVSAVADFECVLDQQHIDLADWMVEHYLAPLWDCLAVSMPSGYGQRSVTMVSAVDVPPLLPLDGKDAKILHRVAGKEQVTLDALRESVGTVTMERLRRLQEAGHITVAQGLARPAGRPKTERHIRPGRPAEEMDSEARRLLQARPNSVAGRLLAALAVDGITLTVARELGAQRSHIDGLTEQGWLEEFEVRVERSPLDEMTFAPVPPLRLSEDQQAIADAIWSGGSEHLIHGVTGSGKTEVYLDLVGRVLAAGGGAIVLVPEISLTPQAVRRFGERFGETLAVFHSGLGTGELYDQWYRVKSADARVILGSRSALFAPVPNLRLVVLDEEHEPSYKQSDPQPRYHTRDTARELAHLTGAKLVLGSATPDIATYHRTETGTAVLHVLRDRLVPDGAGGTRTGTQPQIHVVDMREELKAGNRGIFSVPLARAVKRAVGDGKQAILFVNRRGAARFMLCRDCSHVPECTNCRIALGLDTRDSIAPKLTCHHCGRVRKLDEQCPRCGSHRFRPFGVGTQRVEFEARKVFPAARVARWDSDTSSRKGAHEEMVARLQAGEVDIVVGTQLLAKGLDLPNMAVVGVVDADVGLHLPTYLSQERAFQLISQVAGRAGRRDEQGHAFVQTYEPTNPAILAAANGDYAAFYSEECDHRRRAGYPPFGRLARLTFRHPNLEHGLEESSRVATELRTHRDSAGRADPDVLGPAPAYIRRVRGEYRWGILVRGKSPAELIAKVRVGPRWAVDIDPVNLL